MTDWYSSIFLKAALFCLGFLMIIIKNLAQWRKDLLKVSQYMKPPGRPDISVWSKLPEISILVAAWNEQANIQNLVESFRALRYPHKEMILCAGGSDGTYEAAQRMSAPDLVILDQQPGEGKQRALARAFDLARGEIIYFTDADCKIDDESFELLIYPLVKQEEQAVNGRDTPYEEQMGSPFVVSQYAAHLYANIYTPKYTPGLKGCNCAVHRECLIQSNGLRVPAPTGTDYVLAKIISQKGFRICQVTQSRVQTPYPARFLAYLKQQRRWQKNILIYGWQYKDWDYWFRALIASLIGTAMLISIPIAVVFYRWLLILWILFFTYAIFSRLRYLGVAQRLTPGGAYLQAVLFQPFYLILDFVAWSLPLFTILTKKQRKTW